MKSTLGISLLCSALLFGGAAQAASFQEDLRKLARGWDHAAYEISDEDAQLAELDALETQATTLATKYPDETEPLAWRAIIVSTKANAAEGMTALGFADAARKQLEKLVAMDPDPLGDGTAYAMLGALYDGVPGFPIGFGDKRKARKYLQKAVEQNPSGADVNYFYGAFLAGQRLYKEAKQVLQTALRAPIRPGREVGDNGRRRDVREQIAAIDGKLAPQ